MRLGLFGIGFMNCPRLYPGDNELFYYWLQPN
jgi:hypothetical protein